MGDKTFWLVTGFYTLASALTLWWALWDSKKRWACVREDSQAIHDQVTGHIIREAHAEIMELQMDLARAGRALMAHPQGHDQELIDDAMGWVAEGNAVEARESTRQQQQQNQQHH